MAPTKSKLRYTSAPIILRGAHPMLTRGKKKMIVKAIRSGMPAAECRSACRHALEKYDRIIADLMASHKKE